LSYRFELSAMPVTDGQVAGGAGDGQESEVVEAVVAVAEADQVRHPLLMCTYATQQHGRLLPDLVGP